jgi:hypothetical protein
MENKCTYCYQPRESMEGWHENCAPSRDAKARMEANIEGIMRIANHQSDKAPMTSDQLRNRSDRRREVAQSVRLNGGQTHPEYNPINLNEN